MKFILAGFAILISTHAFAASQTFKCQEMNQPAGKKISVTIDDENNTASFSSADLKSPDVGALISYYGGDVGNRIYNGFPQWLNQVQGDLGSGYMYFEASLLNEGTGHIALYRSYYHSASDCGNQSIWFDCSK